MPEALPTTRAMRTCTCGRHERGSRLRAACRSTCALFSKGEEESGSDHFDPWIEANEHRLSADLAMISDTGFFEGNKPAITVGLRGLVYMQIDVTGSKLDLHSGSFGGNVQNPANALATIIAKLKNEDGSVAVPGFYDEVAEITPRERDRVRPDELDLDSFKSDHGLYEVFGESSSRPSNGAGRGRRWTSTGSGPASRAKAPRRSSRLRHTPK